MGDLKVYRFEAHPYENEKWAAQWTGAVHYLCKLIIISARGLHMGSSVGRSCPLTFKIFIISDHLLLIGIVRLHTGQLSGQFQR